MNSISATVHPFLPIYRLEIHHPQLNLHVHSITSSKRISSLFCLQLPCASVSSVNHWIQVYIQTPSSMASKFFYKLARSQPASSHDECPANLFEYDLQVQLPAHSITGSKCITNLDLSRLPSASLSSLDLGSQVHVSVPSILAS